MVHVQAARLVAHGQPLVVQQLELAEPAGRDVIVNIAYAGVNPVDMYAAEGRVAADGPVPRTLGTEAAGTFEGQPVIIRGYGIGTRRDGLWASAAVVPRAALVAVPADVSLQAAAAMGVVGVTAWRTVTELAEVTSADTVLVLGASGGVGSTIVSVASAIGATVIGHTGQQDSAGWVSERGADQVVVADAAGLGDALAGLHPTAVFDGLGDGFTGPAIEAMAPRGRLVLYGASAGPSGQLPLLALYRKGISLRGYGGLQDSDEVIDASLRQALQALAAGRLAVAIDTVLPLAEVNDAFTRIRERTARGKIVLDVRQAGDS